jgi:hypothetical protein
MGERNYWSAPVPPLGTATNSPTVATGPVDITPQQTLLIPGSPSGLELGTRIRIRACGGYAASSSSSVTLLFDFRLNQLGTALGTTPAILAASTAFTVLTSASVVWPWMMEYEGQVRALTTTNPAANASVYGQGKFFIGTSLTAFTIQAIPATAALRTVAGTATGLLTGTVQQVYTTYTLSATTGVVSVSCEDMTVELLG